MTKFRKILVSLLLVFVGVASVSTLFFYSKRKDIYHRVIEIAKNGLESKGLLLRFDEGTYEVVPPSISLVGVKIKEAKRRGKVLVAKNVTVRFHPLHLLLPGFSPVSVIVSGFSGVVDKELLDSVRGVSSPAGGEDNIFIPDISLKDGHLEIKNGVTSLPYAFLGIKTFTLKGGLFFGKRLRFRSGNEGFEGKLLYKGKEYPLQINSLSFKGRVASRRVYVEMMKLTSPIGDLQIRGKVRRDLDMSLKVSGDLDVEKILKKAQFLIPSNILEEGRFSFAGAVGVEKGEMTLSMKTRLVDLVVKGQKCSAAAFCVVDKGRISLRKVSFNTPAGSMRGKIWFDVRNFNVGGKFTIENFSPGEMASLYPPLSGASIEGTGGGTLTLSPRGEGSVELFAEVTMGQGMVLSFPSIMEKFTWKDPVSIVGKFSVKGLPGSPRVEVSRIAVTEKNSSIETTGKVDLYAKKIGMTTKVNIKKVRSIGTRAILGKSGAIKGTITLSGDLYEPTIDSSLILEKLSLRGLPEGEVIVKGGGLLGGDISIIADYAAPMGSITFSGTYFPGKAVNFVGSVKGRDIKIETFASELFLGDELYKTLEGNFPVLFPVRGTVTFDGDMKGGKGNMNVTGRIVSPTLSAPSFDFSDILGFVSYENGSLELEKISFKAFKGSVVVKGGMGRGLFDLRGEFKDLDPVELNNFLPRGERKIGGGRAGGAFSLKLKDSELEQVKLKISSPLLSYDTARLEGVKLEGRKKGTKITVSLDTSNGILSMKGSYEMKGSSLSAKVTVNDFPLRFYGKDSSPESGLTFSGHLEMGKRGIGELKDKSFLDSLFLLDSVRANIALAPYYERGEMELPKYRISLRKKGNALVSSIDSGGGKKLKVRFSRTGDGKTMYICRGGIKSGTLPIVLPSGLPGSVSSTLLVDLKGEAESFPTGSEGKVTLNDLRFNFQGEEVRSQRIDLVSRKNTLTIKESRILSNNRSFSLKGKVGFDGKTDLSVRGVFDAGIVRAVVNGVFERISGGVEGEVKVAGVYPDLEIWGQGKGEDVTIKFVGFKHSLTNLSVGISFFKDRIVFDDIDGYMGGGPIDGSGEVNIPQGSPVKLFFNVEFNNVSFGYPEELPSQLEGTLELAGPVEDLLLRGEIVAISATYTKPISLEELVVKSEKGVTALRIQGEKKFAIKLDIDGTSEETIRIRNNLADIRAGGSFRIVGDTSNPVVMGTFELVEGAATYRGTEYDIERLVVDFDDPTSNNPRVDGLARAERGNYTVFVEGEGRLNDLSIDLYSDPPLSKNDIVSLLSIGTTSESLEGESPGVSTTDLAGVALAPLKSEIEERIRYFTGLERFSVESNYSQATGVIEPTVVIGKNVGDRFSLDFSTSLTGSGTQNIVTEIKLFKDIYLVGDWSSGGTTSEGEFGGEFQIKKYFRGFSDLSEKLLGGDSW